MIIVFASCLLLPYKNSLTNGTSTDDKDSNEIKSLYEGLNYQHLKTNILVLHDKIIF